LLVAEMNRSNPKEECYILYCQGPEVELPLKLRDGIKSSADLSIISVYISCNSFPKLCGSGFGRNCWEEHKESIRAWGYDEEQEKTLMNPFDTNKKDHDWRCLCRPWR